MKLAAGINSDVGRHSLSRLGPLVGFGHWCHYHHISWSITHVTISWITYIEDCLRETTSSSELLRGTERTEKSLPSRFHPCHYRSPHLEPSGHSSPSSTFWLLQQSPPLLPFWVFHKRPVETRRDVPSLQVLVFKKKYFLIDSQQGVDPSSSEAGFQDNRFGLLELAPGLNPVVE